MRQSFSNKDSRLLVEQNVSARSNINQKPTPKVVTENSPNKNIRYTNKEERTQFLDISNLLPNKFFSFSRLFSFSKAFSLDTFNGMGKGLLNIFFGIFAFFALLVSIICKPISAVSRAVYILSIRWLKIKGIHGAPSISKRKIRAASLATGLQFIAVIIVFRLFALQSSEHTKWEKIASKQHASGLEVAGARGVIYDRNNVELAVSIPSIIVGAHPKWIKDKPAFAKKVSPLIDRTENDILNILSTDKSFITLAKGISQSKEPEIRALKAFGLEVERDFKRVYPHGSLASGIIGKSGKEGKGLSGAEQTFDPLLRAADLTHLAKRDAKGRLLSSATWDNSEQSDVTLNRIKNLFSGLKNSTDGHKADVQREDNQTVLRNEGGDVNLSIDSAVQHILEEEIDLQKTTTKAKNIFGLMMDAHTGEIIASAQTSRFDLNSDSEITPEALRNIVFQNSFEPGSTFKPIITALALEAKVTNPSEMINCENGSMQIGKYRIRDAHPVPTVSLEQVLVRSSNIGMAKLGFRLGRDKLYSELRNFGFGENTGSGLKGEAKGIFRVGSSWANIDIATHSFGQGVSVTAIQLVKAYAALANDGFLVTPTILKADDHDLEKQQGKRILSKKTTDFIRGALYQVTENEHGTGKNSRISGIPVYGKTGTAQKARVGGKGYDSEKILASFIGFADGAPIGVGKTFVLLIGVDEPGVFPRWGGTLAAPVFKNVMERTLSHYLVTGTGKETKVVLRNTRVSPNYKTL